MTTITQTPAGVDIEVAVDDSFSSLVDFSISLTGYTVTAFVDKNDGSQVDMTVTNTDLSAGQVTISLTKAQITSIGTGNHKWDTGVWSLVIAPMLAAIEKANG